MCGFAGYLATSSPNNGESILRHMGDAIVHRGPDDGGIWLDQEAGIGLSFRRLSIIDLSPEGHQPMRSVSGRYIIAFNGEVYNFAELRRELAQLGCSFRGHSDTEVILAAVEVWGLLAAIERFVGMFAIALWDRSERRLHLVRDRVGIKPLYYGWANGSFVFGSELKALKVFPGFSTAVNRGALALLMRHNYVPSPHSIYQDVHKLLPGHILTLGIKGGLRVPEIIPYWSVKDVAQSGLARPFSGTAAEAITQLDDLLRDAVKIRMVADVPLGAFLSGGYDSSTVVAVMQAQSSRPVKTFSIGFHEAGYDEATHAKAVAAHLGTDHTELYVTSQEAMDVIPLMPTLYDEPFSDSSQIPTYLVSQLAREHVTVSLSGDGGDELFYGYNRYAWGQNIWSKIGKLPPKAGSILARMMKTPSTQAWDRVFGAIGPVLPKWADVASPGDKMHKLAGVLAGDGSGELYRRLMSHWDDPCALVLDSEEPLTALTDMNRQAELANFTDYMMFTDQVSYLPDDILTKVDRASMGVSLEARVPILDHRVLEFAWQLPQHLKLRDGETKWILRQVLYKYVPRDMMNRPKMGFGIPIGDWLRCPLREWAEHLLAETRLKDEGFFNTSLVRDKWSEHLSGKRNWQYLLWDVLMFESWLEHQREDQAGKASQVMGVG